MGTGQTTVIGSRTGSDDYRYQMDITSEGAVPISGTVNVDNAYVTSGNVAITNFPTVYPGSVFVENNITLQGVKARGSGLVVFTKEHDREIQGQAYMCGSVYYKMANAGSTCLLFNCGSCDAHFIYDSRTDGDAIMTLMENVVVTASGVENLIINKNRCIQGNSNCSVWTNPTIGASGGVIHTAMYLGGSGAGTKFISAPVGTGIQGGEMIFCAGSSYLIKTFNIAARPLSVDWNISMHEHC